jgi:hypothetical protein
MEVSGAKRLRELEAENRKLKRLLGDDACRDRGGRSPGSQPANGYSCRTTQYSTQKTFETNDMSKERPSDAWNRSFSLPRTDHLQCAALLVGRRTRTTNAFQLWRQSLRSLKAG